MKFYHIPKKLIHLVPVKVYTDNVVILSWIKNLRGKSRYGVYYHYSYYSWDKEFLLYDLTDEDISHLNLLGIPLKISDARTYSSLEITVQNRDNYCVFVNTERV